MSELTERQVEIISAVKSGSHSPTDLAKKLGISVPGASQALQKLADRGKLFKRKVGRGVLYETPGQHDDNELYFKAQAVNSLAQVWAYILSKHLSEEELTEARKARDALEDTLSK